MQGKILVVDDEPSIVDIIRFNLEREGFSVVTGSNGTEALAVFEKEKPDLLLLDVMMPEMDGLEVCRKLRETSNVPILMLTARAEELDKVVGLEFGADDYITKPFSMRELMARVRTNLRRSAAYAAAAETSRAKAIVLGALSLEPERCRLCKNGTEVNTTTREWELIRFLMENPGVIFSRETLLEKVWSYEQYCDPRTVDVTVRRLREKIEDDPALPRYILTKRGIGYFFNDQNV